MAEQGGNFVQGEASESDEEYEIDQSFFTKNAMVTKKEVRSPRQSVVVEGEASESDESDDGNVQNDGKDILDERFGNIQSETTSREHTKRKLKFLYDS